MALLILFTIDRLTREFANNCCFCWKKEPPSTPSPPPPKKKKAELCCVGPSYIKLQQVLNCNWERKETGFAVGRAGWVNHFTVSVEHTAFPSSILTGGKNQTKPIPPERCQNITGRIDKASPQWLARYLQLGTAATDIGMMLSESSYFQRSPQGRPGVAVLQNVSRLSIVTIFLLSTISCRKSMITLRIIMTVK